MTGENIESLLEIAVSRAILVVTRVTLLSGMTITVGVGLGKLTRYALVVAHRLGESPPRPAPCE
jgi:hypothetical protein